MQGPFHILIMPGKTVVKVDAGTLLSDALRAHGHFSAPCGGMGTCGKCGVTLITGEGERRVLACQTPVNRDLTVRIDAEQPLQILTAGVVADTEFTPPPSAGPTGLHGARLAAAFDVGTTTLACKLLDLSMGRTLAVGGEENPQSAFGADVMARLLYAGEHGASALQNAVVTGMNRLLASVCAGAGVSMREIVHCVAVGNTAMRELLLGADVFPLCRAPYQPASCAAIDLRAAELGLDVHPDASLHFLPLIGGFVGADTVACMLATGFERMERTTLLVDIGTNGELALCFGARRVACSTAAGPAFEGALLVSGMRASSGAIDRFLLKDGALTYSVIGGGKPRGICGSGLVSLAACLLDAGTLHVSGRLEHAGLLGDRLTTLSDQAALVVVPADKTEAGAPILFTQRDVRALQLAKAAIAAGITQLCRAVAIAPDAIECVLLAGAFGSALDAASLRRIGLLPPGLSAGVRAVGNAALEGAALAALDDRLLLRANAIAASTTHLALAGSPGFEARFVEEMAFPEAEAAGVGVMEDAP